MAIEIPEAQVESLALLAGSTAEQRERILRAIQEAPPTLFLAKLERHLVEASDLPRSLVRAVLTVSSSLLLTVERLAAPRNELAREVTALVLSRGMGGLKEGTPEAEAFRDFLLALMELENSIGVSAKATDVLADHHRPLLGSRILTDLRPIFSGKDDPRPIAGVVVHTLKLTSRAGRGEETTFYFALDEADLRALGETIERAMKKERALKAKLEEVKWPCIEITER